MRIIQYFSTLLILSNYFISYKIYFLSMANLPQFQKNKTTKGGIAYKTFKY